MTQLHSDFTAISRGNPRIAQLNVSLAA